jgi:predicted esterase
MDVPIQTKPFDEYYNEALQHYASGDYTTVYDLLTADEAHYPDHSGEILYLRSCMAARMGNNALALDLIRQALDQGIWYGETMIRQTPSWQHLQGDPAFEQLAAASIQQEKAAGVTPQLFLREPEGGCSPTDPCPTLLALHGNGDNARHSLQGWGSVADQGWLLAAAQSSQAGMAGFYVWDNQEIALRELAGHYATLRDGHDIDPTRVVIGGFSMGGETALRATLLGTVPVRGFILLGPGGPTIDTPDEWLPLILSAKERGLRGYIFLGESDSTVPHDEIRALVSLLNDHGTPTTLETVPNLAHDYPPDFAARLQRALAFILQ